MSKKRVAIIGYSSRLPGARPAEFWSDLLAGRDLVTQVPADRWGSDPYWHPRKSHPGTSYTFAAGTIGDISGFDAGFFGISPREAAQMDPQQRLLLELAWETLENAGVRPSAMRGSACGVFIGIASVDYSFRFVEDLAATESATATGTSNSIAANRISYALDLHGPSMAIDTACSSSLVAFHLACRSILSDESSHALTGGVSLHMHPYGFVTFSKAAMLSQQGICNVFDAAGDGYVRSEGAGLFLLKDYDQARADGDHIIAIVAGSAVNSDGRKSGITVPSLDAQVALLQHAYTEAGIAPAEVDYIEAHGTGTAVGDPIETHALGIALGQHRGAGHPLLIGSVKSNIGHLEAASGAAGLIKALHSLEHRQIPATIHLHNPNPNIRFDDWNLRVPTAPTPLKAQGKVVLGINSFGFGGANAHVILESPEPEPLPASSIPASLPVPVLLSGKTTEALKCAAAAMASFLRQPQNDAALYDIAWSAAFHRDWHDHRAVIIADAREPLAAALDALVAGTTTPLLVESGTAVAAAVAAAEEVAFVYSGNGSQWEGMGRELLAADPLFRQTIAEIDAIFEPLAGYSLAAELAGNNGSGRYARTEIAQPALFALQLGITAMLRQRGINAAAVAGHSVGEVAAAWASGALTLQQAVAVIYHRSQCQARTRGQGQMTAVALGVAAASAVLAELGLADTVVIAGINSTHAVTVAGPVPALDALERALRARKVVHKRLDLDYAFHSPAMDVIAADVMRSLATLAPHPTIVPFYSTVSGGREDGNTLDASYWWRNIREPVQLADAAASLQAQGVRIFIEIGPHPVLRSYLQQSLHEKNLQGAVIATLQRNDASPARVWRALCQAAIAGAKTQWRAWFPEQGRFVQLPTYPWQHEHYWHGTSTASAQTLQRHKQHPLLGYRLDDSAWVWENQLDTLVCTWLADHVVGETTIMPGTAYAEMALAAALLWLPEEFIEIEYLEIRAPLIFNKKDHSKRLRLSIDPADGTFAIHSRDAQTRDALTLHASGRISSGAAGIRLQQTPPFACAVAPEFDAADHDALTLAAGLAYGPAFRAITAIWRDGESVCARFHHPDAIASDLPATHLHPALLDCAFQLIIELLHGDADILPGVVFVPVRIKELVWYCGAAQPVAARATLLHRGPHTLSASFVLFDATGKPVAAITEARFQRIHTHKNPLERLRYLEYRWVASPHPLSASRAPRQLFDQLHQQLAHAVTAAAGGSGRYATEVEPLLDVLCSRFAAQALHSLAENGELLTRASVLACAEAQPSIMPMLDHLIEILCADQTLLAEGPDWRFALKDDLPAAADLWNGLIRDYPDYLQVIHAVGRVGMHLGELLHGRRTADQLIPRDCRLGSVTRQMLIDSGLTAAQGALVNAVTQTLNELAAGTKLRILELCAGKPLFAAAMAGAFDPDRCGYTVVAVAPTIPEDCYHLREKFPAIEIRQIDAHQPIDHKPLPANRRFQLIIINPDFETAGDALFALSQAKQWLAPRGSLIVLEQHRSPWLDFVFGTRPEWWSEAPAGSGSSRHKSIDFWRRHAQRLGLVTGAALECAPGAGIGPYFLLAHASDVSRPATDTPASRNWLLFADKDPGDYSARLARQLARVLQNRGDRVVVITPAGQFTALDEGHYQLDAADPVQIEALLARAATSLGAIDGILHFQGMAPTATATAPLLQFEKQLDRCTAVAAVIKACAATGLQPACWLFTAGATSMCRTGSPAAAEPAPIAMDAALWGFGRTAMNEGSGQPIRLVDIDPAAPIDTISYLLARELSLIDAEQEIAITAAGERLAPRLRLQPPPAPAALPTGKVPQVTRLTISAPGQLRHLQWQSHAGAQPAAAELEIEVHTAGLNFRDIMYALGALTDDAVEGGFAGPALGLEFAGVVARTGPGVTGFRPGDRVLGFGAHSFSNRLIAKTSSVALIPGTLSFAAAATIPSAFFTVHYALNHLARLEQGEKILIHGAAGGVGIAAIQMAQRCGAEIYATAGSKEKRDFLRLLGVEHIFDSRSLAFAEEILAVTDGQGVDVVLNSLAGEAINRNLRILKPFGRFLELGKRDFQENTRIGLRPFRHNISYFAVDADQLMKVRPELTEHLFREIMTLFAEGVLHPLPYVEFAAEDVVDAFRYMQQSRHIGKIVINSSSGIKPVSAAPAVRQRLELQHDATYLVSGGLRGFGLRTGQWLAAKGARHLVLLSHSGHIAAETADALAALRSSGVEVHTAACDVTDKAALARLLSEIAITLPPLRGIVHAAAVIEDSVIRNLERQQMRRVLAPKILGAQHLHELTRDRELDFLVFYSSATTLFGNPGQAAYVAANAWLEAYAATLRAGGRRALCVGWGAIADAGFLARNRAVGEALNKRMGGAPLTAAVALDALEELLLANRSGLGVLELDWPALARFLPSAGSPKFSELRTGTDESTSTVERRVDVRNLLSSLSPAEATATITGMLKTEIGEILRIAPEKIDEHRVLHDLGFDSLMGVELGTAVESRFTVRLPLMALNDAPTVAKLTIVILERLRGEESVADLQPSAQTADLIEQGREIAAKYAEGEYARAIALTADEMQSGELVEQSRIIH
ncbi:MAG: SDR family NAD(P)-dependent oxidoreductase [Burkholderiales bacterium]|nr:SDR family NAD(P)-dependent oxidoreductase [Burkholderiales bacterium]